MNNNLSDNLNRGITDESDVSQPTIVSWFRQRWIFIVSVFLFIGLIGAIFLFIKITQEQKIKGGTPSINPPRSSEVSTPNKPVVTEEERSFDSMVAFSRKDGIYIIHINGGNPEKIFDTREEELAVKAGFIMKWSPDKRMIAYIGTSGGLDSAIKVINLADKKKIYQAVFGSAEIADISWDGNSDKIAVAVNQRNSERNYSSSIHLLNLGDKSQTALFPPENIKITKVDWRGRETWPNIHRIYYSRISYAKNSENTAAIVAYDPKTGSRKIQTISYFDENGLSFVPTDGGDGSYSLFCTWPKNYSSTSKSIVELLTVPNLTLQKKVESYFPCNESTVWTAWREGFLSIESPFGSPDQSVIYEDAFSQKEALRLLDMGPSGAFHSVNSMQFNNKRFLVVWSEFDRVNSISVYDFDKLVEMRQKSYTGDPVWKVTDSFSPTL